MKYFLFLVLLLNLTIISACSRVDSFETTIDSVNNDSLLVNCSNEVNLNKKGNIYDIGYLCEVRVDESTILKDNVMNSIRISDLKANDRIRIKLLKAVNISEKNRTMKAAEIQLLN